MICPDLGAGYDEKRQVATSLSLSALGRGEIEIAVKSFGPDAYQQLRLSWPRARSIVTIDNCAVVFRGDGQTSGIDVTRYVTFDGDVEERDGIFTLGPEGAHALVSLGTEIPTWPHALDLRLRFTYLRLDRVF